MKYVGSKARISRHILPIIQGAIDRNGIETYVEPFVGGGNLIDKVHCHNRIGYDNNEYLIGFWQAGVISAKTNFAMGKDLKSGEVVVNEYGKQIPGQMSFSDLGQKEEGNKVTPIQQPRKLGTN